VEVERIVVMFAYSIRALLSDKVMEESLNRFDFERASTSADFG